MSVRFMDSFDHYQDGDNLYKWTLDVWHRSGLEIVAGAGRCGSNAGFAGSIVHVVKGINLHALATAPNGVMGFAYKRTGALTFPHTITGVSNVNSTCWYAVGNQDGSVSLYTDSNVLIGTTPADTIRDDTWYFIEFKWHLHASTGTFAFRVNENELINETGLAFGQTAWTSFYFGSDANHGQYIDDLYILDDYDDGLTPATNDFLGDVRVEYLRPTSNGNYSQWDVSSGDHYNAVDKNYSSSTETPYISTDVVGEIDTNGYSDPSLQDSTIFAVQTNILAKKDNAGTRTLAAVTRSGGADDVGPDMNPSQDSFSYLITPEDRNPVTGAAWTITDINAAEWGVKVTS